FCARKGDYDYDVYAMDY
nr:immunoglobulin heavy chain junction region [Mus musculus]